MQWSISCVTFNVGKTNTCTKQYSTLHAKPLRLSAHSSSISTILLRLTPEILPLYLDLTSRQDAILQLSAGRALSLSLDPQPPDDYIGKLP